MLLAYYIASLNIEHANYELTGNYETFEGLCFVDTLDIAEREQKGFSFLTEQNTQRVERQKSTPITVIIGNPPYNMGQKSENENNKNRRYDEIDARIRETYARDSKATLKNKLYDPYVRFFRWAIDRLENRPGIVCYVSNNSFIDHGAFDGMQMHLLRDFSRIYHIDLHGDVNRDRTLSGTQHNVFGIQLGVGITVAVRDPEKSPGAHSLYYHRVPERWTRLQKLAWLAESKDISSIAWEVLPPHTWLQLDTADEFESMIPFATKETKKLDDAKAEAIFRTYTVGVLTARDEVAYDFQRETLVTRMDQFIEDYNAEVDRLRRLRAKQKKAVNIDKFVRTDMKWTHNLKGALGLEKQIAMDEDCVRRSMYRPFCKQWLYFDRLLNERVYLTPGVFPTAATESDNIVICCTIHNQMPFTCLATNCLPNEAIGGRNGQCFALYTYSHDGAQRLDNITDWALDQFRSHYDDQTISKRAIFNYVYAMLHHPLYRDKFAQNLQKDLPRAPIAEDFWQCARIGEHLISLHLGYEQAPRYELHWIENPQVPFSPRVAGRLRLDKDAGTIEVNDSLTLAGIPEDAFNYVLGTRSALEWVVDQYRLEQDEDGNITSDPNDADNDQFIPQLIERITTVSLQTLEAIRSLPPELDFSAPGVAAAASL